VRHPIARLLFALATIALVVLIIVTITGGFLIQLGPLRLSAHNWRGPLLIAVAATVAAAARYGRSAIAESAQASWTFIDDHAAALAVVLAAATAGIGIGYGTYSASSSDASGYVSESALIASGEISSDEPLARTVAWRNATWAFSPLGYRPGVNPGELVPTYPAGLPLVMTPFRLLGGELATYFAVPLCGAIAVLATFYVGARLHSRYAGLAAAVLIATSPILLFQIVQPMSDVPATAWWALALVFALLPVPSAPLAAGGAAGLAILTRPNLLPFAIVIALATMNFPRRQLSAGQSSMQSQAAVERRLRPDRLLGFIAGITPAIGALLLMQWRLFASPFASGYGTLGDLYSVRNIAPNLAGYSGRIVEGEMPALITAIAAAVILIVTRPAPSSAPPLKRAVVLATLVFAIVGLSYLPYAVFVDWSYLRFLLPAFPLVFVVMGGILTAALLRLAAPIRAPLLLCTLAAVGSFNVVRAEHEQAFNMQRYESRYRLAGRFLASALPPRAVIVAVQQSGSARYYTRRPILRWDWLDPDLDTAVAALRARGWHPVFVVEDWERPDLIKKHPASANAQFDWRPRAEIGDDIHVFLYDPLDRTNPPHWVADRIH